MVSFFWVLLNEAMSKERKRSFSHVPIRMLQVLKSMVRELCVLGSLNNKRAAFKHSLPNHNFRVSQLLNKRRNQLSIVLLDIHLNIHLEQFGYKRGLSEEALTDNFDDCERYFEVYI